MYANPAGARFNPARQYAFLRKYRDDVVLVVVNFDDTRQAVEVAIPAKAFAGLGITDNQAAEVTDLWTGETSISTLTATWPYQLKLPPLSACLLRFRYKF